MTALACTTSLKRLFLVTKISYPSDAGVMLSTFVSSKNLIPFVYAFSASAIVRLNGHTIPPVGAYNAKHASSDTFWLHIYKFFTVYDL